MSAEAILLGIAQDGGVPHAGCNCDNCRRAWADSAFRQWVACLGLVDHTNGQSWLIDATPDFPEQLHALNDLAPDCPLAGIVLTHAHIGHYSGLIYLGREVMDTRSMPVYATPRLADFLRHNAPWSQLVALHNVSLRLLTPDDETWLSPDLRLIPVLVPHRDESSDTVAFVVRGPSRQLFYSPDIDGWDRWERNLRDFIAEMDVALLDATFFSSDELPGREMSDVPHPLATDTAERLVGVDCDVRLIHLNHTNPLLAPGLERDWLAKRGIGVGAFGERWSLG
ncbi:MAG TPA: pyrroloquinoline quinone biosynthesis protein PqqB [Anaerolineae bacterium]|nr:pyrroloquinoline quinone biosynthesis protein PqqB [Anaerolineae bacterium]